MTQATATAQQVTVELPMIAQIFKRQDYDSKGRFTYFSADVFWVDENREIKSLCQYGMFMDRKLDLLKDKLKSFNIEVRDTLEGAIPV